MCPRVIWPEGIPQISQQSLRLRSIWYTGTHAQLLFPAFLLTTSLVFSACYSHNQSILSVYRIILIITGYIILNQVKMSDSDGSDCEQLPFIQVRQGLEHYSFEPMRADDLSSWSSSSTGSRSFSGAHTKSDSDSCIVNLDHSYSSRHHNTSSLNSSQTEIPIEIESHPDLEQDIESERVMKFR